MRHGDLEACVEALEGEVCRLQGERDALQRQLLQLARDYGELEQRLRLERAERSADRWAAARDAAE